MINLEWSNQFELGHERIDSEHRIFLDLIRNLSTEAGDGAPAPRFLRLLHETVKYGEFHFVSEENIMEDVGYPELDAHRSLHRMLLSQLRDRVHDISLGRETPNGLVSFLFDWFALHTTREDRKIRDYAFAKDGVTS